MKELWIGLAHVKQQFRNGVLGDADQAYVNVMALAKDSVDFHLQVKQAIHDLDLILIDLEDAETMASRLSKHSLHEDLSNLAEEVKQTGGVRFDVFQTFDGSQ
jgi:hypothetical protein